jgi:diguanylate cyclase (GGDEF)-like protein
MKRPYSMIMLDIDKFKSVNDQYGHLTGDEVIKSIVWLAGNHIRKSDILGRYGGEEFIVVLPHTPPGERR